jgi:hypothetical protein
MRKTLLAVCGVTLGLGLAPVYAETLQMADAPTVQARGPTPSRGTSKAAVEAQFGSPSEKMAAVGSPPISRWIYPTFTVFFEGDRVIHAVYVAR